MCQLKHPKCCISNCSAFDLKWYEISGFPFPPLQTVTTSAVTLVWSSIYLLGYTFVKLSFFIQDQLIGKWPWLKGVRKREHQFLCYTITCGEAQACELESTSDPGRGVNQSKIPIQTWVKSLIQRSDTFQLSHQVTQLPERAPVRTHPAPPLLTTLLPRIPAELALRMTTSLQAHLPHLGYVSPR